MAQPASVAPAQAPVRVRPAVAGDVAFLSAVWKESMWHGSEAYGKAGRVRWSVFKPYYSEIVRRLLERCPVLVACDPEREEEILGYLVYEPGALVWAYVRPAFRRAGLFTALIRAAGLPADLAGIETVCLTRLWSHMSSKYPNAIRNPFRAFMERP